MKQTFCKIGKLIALAAVFFIVSNSCWGQSPENLPTGFDYTIKTNSDGTMFVAFQNNGHIYFSKSTDGGKSFNPGVQVDQDLITQFQWEKPFISGSVVEIVIITFLRSANPESTFIPARFISSDSGQTFSASYVIGGVYSIVAKRLPVPTSSDTVNLFEMAERNLRAPSSTSKQPYLPPNMPDAVDLPVPGSIKGSFDLDTVPTIYDVAILLDAVFFDKKFPPNSLFSLGGADVNCDGNLSTSDVVIELNAVFIDKSVICPNGSPPSR